MTPRGEALRRRLPEAARAPGLRYALGRWLVERRDLHAVGLGLRWRGGERTGEPAVVVLVDRKRPLSQVSPAQRVPPLLFGWPTDVRDSGPFLGTSRPRPVPGGASIGHEQGESGTLACRVRDASPGGDGRSLLLSNNHVLTCFNRARAGDPIIQPARAALGYAPRDTIARLLRWVPLALDPPTPAAGHQNLVDAAVAEAIDRDALAPGLLGLGPIASWRSTEDVPLGLRVAKSGAISGVTRAEVTVLDAAARLNFNGVGVAMMYEQILTTQFTQSGDSGALVVSEHGDACAAVGLVCGASRRFSMVNPIEAVQRLLEIRVAEARWMK